MQGGASTSATQTEDLIAAGTQLNLPKLDVIDDWPAPTAAAFSVRTGFPSKTIDWRHDSRARRQVVRIAPRDRPRRHLANVRAACVPAATLRARAATHSPLSSLARERASWRSPFRIEA